MDAVTDKTRSGELKADGAKADETKAFKTKADETKVVKTKPCKTKLYKQPYLAAISGVKNSGKTTFLEHLVAELKKRGYRVAVIKHDGHDFEPDVEGTDTWKLRHAGAYGTAIFSKGKWMVVKEQPDMDEKTLSGMFPEADFILLEGFKYSAYPKFEIVRKENSSESVCDAKTLLGLITDTELKIDGIPVLNLCDYKTAADILGNCIKIRK